jgi:single-stranded DNA-binding protein
MFSLTNLATLIGVVTSEPRFQPMPGGDDVLTCDVTTRTAWQPDSEPCLHTEVHHIVARGVFARHLHAGGLAVGHWLLCEGNVRTQSEGGVKSAVIEGQILNDLGVPPGGERPARNGVVLHGVVAGWSELQEAHPAVLTFHLATKENDEGPPELHTIKVSDSRAPVLHGILWPGYSLAIAGELRYDFSRDGEGRQQRTVVVHAHEVQLVARPVYVPTAVDA